MKSLKLIGGLVLLTVLLTGCGGEKDQGAAQTNEGTVQDENSGVSGEGIYNERCASCHGQDLKGMGQDLTTVKDRLSKEEIMEVNKNGRGMMPGGQVNDEENKAVTNWLLGQ